MGSIRAKSATKMRGPNPHFAVGFDPRDNVLFALYWPHPLIELCYARTAQFLEG